MKIIVVINDSLQKYEEYQHIGVLNAPCRRVIEIELTEQQLGQLQIEPYEIIESVSLKIES